MPNFFTLFLTILLTIWLTHLWLDARTRWKQGQGLLRAAKRAQFEQQQILWEAKKNYTHGMRQVVRALILFVLLVVMGVLAMVAVMIAAGL